MTPNSNVSKYVSKCRHETFHFQSKRLIIVGDVHGCFDELEKVLHQCNFDNRFDKVVLVGDLVNKGPKSNEVIKFAKKNKFLCVRGNHDEAAMSRIGKCADENIRRGYGYVNELDEDDIAWLHELPYTITIPELDAIIVHAGLVPGICTIWCF